jgi:hypothetical protein
MNTPKGRGGTGLRTGDWLLVGGKQWAVSGRFELTANCPRRTAHFGKQWAVGSGLELTANSILPTAN